MLRGVALLAVSFAGVLGTAPSAEAGIVHVYSMHERDAVEYRDDDGIADDLRITSAGDTVVVTGPGVVAGAGCVAQPGGAACTVQVTPPFVRASLGGGDDRMVVEEPVSTEVFSGPGNDAVRAATGFLEGEAGNDQLTLTGGTDLDPDGDPTTPSRLLGQDGDDRLIAGSGATELAGGPGRDVIVDSTDSDVIVAADDGGTPDAIECRGGEDYIERDAVDAMVRCDPKPLNRLARIDYRYALYDNGVTVFRRLAVAYPSVAFNDARLFARCRRCRGARLRVVFRGLEYEPIRIVSGGARVPGTRRRGLRPGAIVFVGFEMRVGDVAFRKGTELRTRRRARPGHRKLCQTRARGEPWRTVPCVRRETATMRAWNATSRTSSSWATRSPWDRSGATSPLTTRAG